MIHDIKLNNIYAERIVSGKKKFEVRLNDRDYQVGDMLRLNPVSGKVDEIIKYKVITAEIEYVHSGLGLQENYVILGLKNIGCIETLEKLKACPNCLQTEPNYYCERCRP